MCKLKALCQFKLGQLEEGTREMGSEETGDKTGETGEETVTGEETGENGKKFKS